MVNAISRSSQIPQLLKNSKTVLRNYGYNFIQDHSALKPNTLIWAMLALVVARIVIAHHSAQRAKGTPNAAFRHREAIQTTFRESAGWVLSYYVLRAIQASTKYALRKLFGIKEDPKGVLKVYDELKAQVSALWKRSALPEVKKMEDALDGFKPAFKFDPKSFGYRHFKGFVELFSRDKAKALQNFYETGPLIFGSVIAVFLSGYVLERFSLKYAPKLIHNISNWFNNRSNPETPSPALAVAEATSIPSGIRFNATSAGDSENPRYSPFEVTPLQLRGFSPTLPSFQFPSS